MAVLQIDGNLLKQMITVAAHSLEEQKETVNALNVFPVPDGDTGSNMSLTMAAAHREVERSQGGTAGVVAQALAQGSLMGARGNSGVILSQLFRGFARYAADLAALDARDLAKAFHSGVDTAYKAVMKPVEGTILTVARESAAAAVAEAKKGMPVRRVLEICCQAAEASLARTPELLPVLKKAGVVDSGGKGLTVILSGYLAAVRAAEEGIDPVTAPPAAPDPVAEGPKKDVSPVEKVAFQIDEEISDIQFPYDTELFIRGQGIPLEHVAELLDKMGDSVYVVGSPELAKVHIHTDNPGPVLSCCIQFGELIDINIHNMREQHADLKARAEQPAAGPAAEMEEWPSGVVAVVQGPGLEAIFKSLGAAVTISGGQTMNPSTQDILDAIAACPAPEVFVLPNNKNIILAAEQAAAMAEKKVYVVKSRSIPEGIAALVTWQPDQDPEKSLKAMERSLTQVETGEITYAVRDTQFGDLQIKEGDMLGIWNGEIVTTGREPADTLKEVLRRMVEKVGGEIVTIYYGEDVEPEQAQALAADLQARYPDHEIEVQFGGQPIYYYVFSLE